MYRASIALERRKIHEKICQLHALLMLEVAGHQARLANAIDLILPAWLRRGELFAGRQDAHFERLSFPPHGELSIKYFRMFLKELVHSPLLVSLTVFYDGLARLNLYCTGLERQQIQRTDFIYVYMPEARDILNFSIELMESLIATKDIDTYLTKAHRDLIDNFNMQKQRYKYLIELSRLNYRHLSILEQYTSYISAPKTQQFHFERLLSQSLEEIERVVNEIPKMIREDQNQAWLSYLEAAKDVFGVQTEN